MKPTLKKGPASAHESSEEIIHEFNCNGVGGLLSIRWSYGSERLILEPYHCDQGVIVKTAAPDRNQRTSLAKRIEEFSDECEATEYTDLDLAWRLLFEAQTLLSEG